MTSTKHRDIREKIKDLAIGTVALLTMTVPILSTAVAQTEEVFANTNAVTLGPSAQPLASFDMSFVDPTLGLYLLADRSNAAIDVLQTGTNSPTPTTLGAGVFVGIASGGNSSGPNGVITANKSTEVWAGDGPSMDSITGLSTSHVVVIDVSSNLVTHKIDTGGVMRAGKLCEDPKHHMVLVANDDPQDLFLSFISTNNYKVIGKITLNGLDPNGAFVSATNAINGIAQCQWDTFTNNFYVAVPEVGGSGDNSSAGAVLVIDPNHMNVKQVFTVDNTHCVGPQGMALGPNPQILLGCSGVGAAPYSVAPGSVVISAIDGSTIFNLPDLNGVDEVWYNSTDNSYFLAGGNNTIIAPPSAPTLLPLLGLVDAGTPDQTGQEDQVIFLFVLPGEHSLAVDPSAKTVYVPLPPNPIGCTSGCIVLAAPSPAIPDDPGVVASKK
jgi:hypothetical protein